MSEFSVSQRERAVFCEDEVVKAFLRKYDGTKVKGRWSSRDVVTTILCRYFKWLRIEKGLSFTPKELLEDHNEKLRNGDVVARNYHEELALEHTREAFQGLSDSRQYHIFSAIRNFYAYYNVPLCFGQSKFGKRQKRKYHPAQITISQAKTIIGLMKQRERTVLLCMLQSGMELSAVLYKFNYMWTDIKRQLEEGRARIKVEIDERKGNGNWYFTYIGHDAIQELKKWLVIRERIVQKLPEPNRARPIFITNDGTPYGAHNFYGNYNYTLRKHKVKTRPYEKVSQQFRKLFKTEASVPDRGIDRSIIEFFMGHTEGVALVGAEYDRTPEIYEGIIEKEYMKVEPYVNIFTGQLAKNASLESENVDLKRRIANMDSRLLNLEKLIDEALKEN